MGILICTCISLVKVKVIKLLLRKRRGRQMMRWLDGNGQEFEQILGDGDGQGSLMCYSPWGYTESDMTK